LARAKHTDRSAARRRYRLEQAPLPDTADDDAAEEAAPATQTRRPTKAAPSAQPARIGMTTALRSAFRPLDLRGDLQAAPSVLLNWAVAVSIVAAIVSSAIFILTSNELGASLDFTQADPYAGKAFSAGSNLSFLVVGFFVTPPPAAGAFIVGFFAKRASWLGGLVVGIVAAICYSVILLSPAGRLLIKDGAPNDFVLQALVLAPIGAVLFASAAAWYRRFLTLANPNRGQQQRGRQAAKPKPKPAAGRSTSRR